MVPRVIRMLIKAFRVNLKGVLQSPSLKTKMPTCAYVLEFMKFSKKTLHVGILVFREAVSGNFFRFTLKAFISIRVTLGNIQNDYFDHVRHVWDIFGTIRSLKIIFWDYIFENFRLKMNKNTFFGILWLYKGNYYLFKLRNEEFRCLRSEYMTIIIS